MNARGVWRAILSQAIKFHALPAHNTTHAAFRVAKMVALAVQILFSTQLGGVEQEYMIHQFHQKKLGTYQYACTSKRVNNWYISSMGR